MTKDDTLMDKLAANIATLGPVGHLPKAPGTWGSAATVIACPFLFIPFSLTVRLIIIAAIFIIGAWAAGRAEKTFGKKDPGCVVIDEVAGQLVTFLFFPGLLTWHVLAGFLLFRLFDITKPFPVKRAEHWLPGGWGVMIDDVMAGLYAAAVLWGLRWASVTFMAKHMGGSMM